MSSLYHKLENELFTKSYLHHSVVVLNLLSILLISLPKKSFVFLLSTLEDYYMPNIQTSSSIYESIQLGVVGNLLLIKHEYCSPHLSLNLITNITSLTLLKLYGSK